MSKLKTKHQPATAEAKGHSDQRLVSQIVNALFRVNNGDGTHTNGNRLAVMAGEIPNEKHLGGWCREAASREIAEVLANAAGQPTELSD